MSEKCEEHQEMVRKFAEMKRDLAHNTALTEDILRCVKGNGSIGLMTQTALNVSSIKRAWWWLGSLSVAILGVFMWVIKEG